MLEMREMGSCRLNALKILTAGNAPWAWLSRYMNKAVQVNKEETSVYETSCKEPPFRFHQTLLNPMLTDAMRFSGLPRELAGKIQATIGDLSWGFEFGQIFDLAKGITLKMGHAGHILGSSFIRFEDPSRGWSVLFSGDLGSKNTPILRDPEIPEPADLLILESTDGDRLHDRRDQRIRRLGEVLTRALADGSKVFIPAFSLGRTQELINEMDRIFSNPDSDSLRMFPDLQGKAHPPVFVDLPLGLEITRIYAKLSEYGDQEARDLQSHGDHPIDFEGLFAVEQHRNHIQLCDMHGPAIILAGSGMCTGGRIINHLKKGIGDPRNDILFVGYQAVGTPGRNIQQYAGKPGGYVDLDGVRKTIKARVHTLTGYSAHADQQGLVDLVTSMPGKPGAIKLVHGEDQARRKLAEVLTHRGYSVEG